MRPDPPPYLIADAASDPRVKPDLIQALQLGSAVFAPVLRGGDVLGVLKLQSSRTIAFDRFDLDMLVLFAGAATAGLAEAAAHAAPRRGYLLARSVRAVHRRVHRR